MNADDPMDDKSPESKEALNFDDVDRRANEVAEGYLGRLRKGGDEDYADLVELHPELAPHLETRLRLYAALFKATRALPETSAGQISAESKAVDSDFPLAGSATIDASSTRGIGRHVSDRMRCPHCGNQVQVVGTAVQDVTCGSCGSAIRFASSALKGTTCPTESFPVSLPKKLGHFRIVRLLGEGAFGVVYLAEDLNLARQVAIKVPRHGFFATLEEEQRFFREANNVAQLRHPNIVRVYEVSEDRDTPFIVSEFIDGLTLSDLLSGGKLTHQESANYAIQIAEAIEYAHRKGVVHRDLKTSNILIDRDGRAFVVDFGLSRRDDAEITMTLDGVVLGTLQYMPPEQAAGIQSDVGPHSDVYSMGVILYEMLCRDVPFHGTKRMMIHQVINDEPKSPRRLNESVPKDLETITLKAMAKKPSQRYFSAGAFADDLRRWLRGEPILARPVSRFARFVSWCRRHPTTAGLSATIAALLMLGTAISTLSAFEQSRLAKIADQAKLQSESRRYELLMQNGTNALESDDLTNSALWFSEALAIEDNSINRTRLGMIQDRLPKLTRLWSTGAPLKTIHFDERGLRLAAASGDDRIAVFDMLTGEKLFDQTADRFSQLKFAPAGDKLVTCGSANHAQLWDVASKRLVKLLPHTDIVVSSDFHASGEIVATGSFDSHARIWNTADGSKTVEREFPGLRVNRVAFIPETDLVVVVTSQANQLSNDIHVWDYRNDRLVATGLHHDAHIATIDFAEHGTRICSATRDGAIRVWNSATGEAVADKLTLPYAPLHVVFGGSDQQAISISYDFDVHTWDIGNGTRAGKEIRRAAKFASAALDRSNRLIALGAGDGTVKIYWRSTGSPACSVLRNSESAAAMAFHPDGHRLAIGGRSGMLQLWDLAGAAPKSQVFEHVGEVRNALFTPDGKRCLTVGRDGKAFIWNVETGVKIGLTLEHTGGILDCSASGDGKLFATASEDNSVKLWDAYSGVQIGQPLAHESAVLTLAISPSGKRVVTGCLDGAVSCWEVSAGQGANATPIFVGKHGNRVGRVVYSPSGEYVASASLDGTIRCWDAETGFLKFGPLEHPNESYYCEFMPGGDKLISCGTNGWVFIWDLASESIVHRLKCAGTVRSAVVFAGGERIMTNEDTGRTRLWRLVDGQMVFEYDLQHVAIESANYSQSNRDASILAVAGGSLASGSDIPKSGAAVLWDPTDRRLLGPPLSHLAFVRRVYFDGTGKKILTASTDHTARLWTLVENGLPTDDAIRIARMYAQMESDAHGVLRTMAPEKQLREFAELSARYPDYFRCDASEVESWNGDVRRLHETN